MRGMVSLCALIVLTAGARAQQQPEPASQPVSREEYERVLREQSQMSRELDELKAARDRGSPPATSQPAANPRGSPPVTREDIDELDKEVRSIGQQVHSALPGTEHLLIAGDGAFGFTNRRKTNSTFFAGIAPL